MRKIFVELDRDGDGKLSKYELMQALESTDGIPIYNIDKIMNKCDPYKTGFIDYTQFLAATLNWRTLLDNKRLEAAFNIYDLNGSGKISITDIELFFGESEQVVAFKDLLQEIDLNGDGEVDFFEFKTLMVKHLQ